MPTDQLLHPHGNLTANDVMVDYLDDNQRRLRRTLAGISDDCLHWKADEESNSIATNLWHMARILDVFVTHLALGLPTNQERWIAGGWAKETNYDPRGIGRDGWGSVNEYTLEEVSAMPKFSLGLLIDFIDDVYKTVRDYICSSSLEILCQPANGFNGQYTRYQVISMAVIDNVRHLGEIRLIKSLWERSI